MWVQRRIPLARLRPAHRPACAVTPGAAAASPPGPLTASQAASFEGWGLPPETNHEVYANKGRAEVEDLPCVLVWELLAQPSVLLFLHVRLLFRSIWNYFVCLLSVLLALLRARVCLLSTVVLTEENALTH